MKIGSKPRIVLALALGMFAAAQTGSAQAACTPGPTTLCLGQNRFEVKVEWRDFQGTTGSGHVLPFSSDDSGLFWFFGAENWEMLVKVLDGCAATGHFWVYSAATTDVEYTLRVRDTLTGASRSYFNPLGRSAPAVTDSSALPVCSIGSQAAAASLLSTPRAEPATVLAGSACGSTETSACLERQRFKVEVGWRDFQGKRGAGRLVPFGSDNSALFWFFGSDNWEMLVKVLDGCASTGHFWVYSAATTDVEYTLKVTDTFTGQVREYRNPLGRSAPAITDSSAFATCSASGPPRIELVSDPTVILTRPGEQALLEARVVDSQGREVPGAQVEWTSSDESLFEISSEGPLTARVTAVSQPPGSATVRASYGGIAIDTMVLLASVGPRTVLLDSGAIESAGPSSLILKANPRTASLEAGQILVGTGEIPVVARILSVSPSSEEVVVETEPASLAEAFKDLLLHVQGTPLPDPARDKEGLGEKAPRSASGASLLQGVQCKLSGRETVSSAVEASLALSMDPDFSSEVMLHVKDFTVERFTVALRGALTLTSEGGSLTFHARAKDTLTCAVSLPEREIPVRLGFLGALTFGARPVVGVEVTPRAVSPGLSMSILKGSVRGSVVAGIDYTAADGWRTIAEHDWSSRLEPFQFDLDLGDVGVEGLAFAGLGVSLGGELGFVDLIETNFLDVRGGASFNASLAFPFDETSALYTGPRWDVGLRAVGSLEPKLTDSALKALLDHFGLEAKPAFDVTLFDVKAVYAQSPRFTISADRVRLDPRQAESALLSVAGATGDGTIQFAGRRGLLAPLSILAEAGVANGQGAAAWTPSEDDLGSHEIYGRLRIDPLSRQLPYASGNSVGIEVVAEEEEVPPPVITEVSPNPVAGSAGPTTLTIVGHGFLPGALVRVQQPDPGNHFIDYVPTSAAVDRIVAEVSLGSGNVTWGLKVVNPDGQISNLLEITVQGPQVSTAPVIDTVTFWICFELQVQNCEPPFHDPTAYFLVTGRNFQAGAQVILTAPCTGEVFTDLPVAEFSGMNLLFPNPLSDPLVGSPGPRLWSIEVVNPDGQTSNTCLWDIFSGFECGLPGPGCGGAP